MAKATMVLIFSVLMLACVVGDFTQGIDDEWYCKKSHKKYQICHNNIDGEATAQNQCQCENLWMARNDDTLDLYGGPEQCDHPDEDNFCFISGDSECFDAEYSSANERLNDLWGFDNGYDEVYYSYEACDADDQDDRIGNEKVIQGVKIKDDRIREVDENEIVTDKEVTFYTDDWEECQGECLQRQGNCGAWSFDKEEEICYIHTVESCCGQFGKRKKDPDWVSGYVCHKCWSTKRNTDCPCSIQERQQVPNTAHGAGGRAPLHATSSGSLTVQSVNVAKNACKCKPKRNRRGRIRCRKPFCAKNQSEEGCQDKRKCRLRKKRKGRSLVDLLYL